MFHRVHTRAKHMIFILHTDEAAGILTNRMYGKKNDSGIEGIPDPLTESTIQSIQGFIPGSASPPQCVLGQVI